jgi:hypothetical protein
MFFRSETEKRVAMELDKNGLLFFANAKGRIGTQGSPVSDSSGLLNGRLEVDFLVFHKGKCIILEVDGLHHQYAKQSNRDHVRDRVLLREGISTARFTAKECYEQTKEVVIEFLNLF